ncbi:DDE-type integrase/transposase/recombinase [Clostridium sp. D43t1_170807_H7]|uniref:DDE-type integrase/transposase/recombinase n=1 Tax=Clostridium sp. D43t1_170807_H7 TaxID=2787140 RepID=UPI0018978AF3|nr:DDE-type integrase/transposase/recombinase [Clostridium sp. D43t1_170807_H7]
MDEKLRREIALFRFSLIAPILNNTYPNKTVKDYLEEICAKVYDSPLGLKKEYAPSTIKEWLRLYKTKGIDGLYPKNRSDKGESRKLKAEVKELVISLKKANPKRTAKSIYQEIIITTKVKPFELSLSTVQRYIKNLDLSTDSNIKDRRAFEFENANDCWQSDISVGPYLTINGVKHKTYIVAFLDDASRLIVSCKAFKSDNLLSVLEVFKDAVATRGVPKKVFFDNGKVYRSGQMELICASLGCALCFAEPYSPQSKGKIERWFQTLQKQWQQLIDTSSFQSIDELNKSLNEYVELNYNRAYHNGIKDKPINKFLANIDNIKRFTEQELRNVFLYRVERKVKNDSTVSIDKEIYEVPSKYIGSKLYIRYDPTNNEEAFIFSENGERLERIVKVNKIDNSKLKRGSKKEAVDFSPFSDNKEVN